MIDTSHRNSTSSKAPSDKQGVKRLRVESDNEYSLLSPQHNRKLDTAQEQSRNKRTSLAGLEPGGAVEPLAEAGQDHHNSNKNMLLMPLDEDSEIARRRALRAQIRAKHNHEDCQSETSRSARETPTLEESLQDSRETSRLSQVGLSPSITEVQAAADYDPNADQINEHETRRKDILAHDLPHAVMETAVVVDNAEEEDDMFADPVVLPASQTADSSGQGNVGTGKRLDASVLESWADHEGYYRIMIGELLDERYSVQAILGKGVFSAVVKCVDQETGESVAIKVIRNNDVMRKAGRKEIAILEQLMLADPEDRKHIVRLHRTFEHRGHLCLVFESLSLNLREVLKKFGRDVGISIKAVRAYTQQIFLALSLMRKCNIMHTDLKPDNILVSENRTMLKVCDLGSASDTSESVLTAYLASRFYRAPEVILGLPYDASLDVWAIGCTLYEMYTGQILFPGRNNNQMLRLFMECRGKLPLKMLKKAVFVESHFDEGYDFVSVEPDKVTGESIVRSIKVSQPTRDLRARLMSGTGAEERALVAQFTDFLERCLELDPMRRILPSDALKHPFIARSPSA